MAAMQRAAVGNDGIADRAVDEARARQKARVREDRPVRIGELERRAGFREHDVGVVEVLNRADVRPEVAEQKRLHTVFVERGWNDLAAEILGSAGGQYV